ncbi:MAG: serine/threonine protein kinase [Myxococcales bacterium]|nr:serine/threonine protein kinase [Myxococcales bacterium]
MSRSAQFRTTAHRGADRRALTPASGERRPPPSGAEKIGRYAVLGVLGEGGMGVVYSAYDDDLDRKVALKLVRSLGAHGREERLRIKREAQALARLSHPNVVQVYEVGEHRGQLFVAMEFIRGATLSEWIALGDHDWRARLEILIAAGRGLAAAHEAGLVHRDFKPENVLVDEVDGRPRVLDFGLARALDDGADEAADAARRAEGGPEDSLLSQEVTRAGALLGTPAYMSPEQFAGAQADARSDQFSFCVTLWEALYGARPFAGESLTEIAFNVGEGRLRAPANEGGVPSWVQRVIARGLCVTPRDRWPSMDALLEELGGDPVRARRRWLAIIGSAALLAGAGYGAARLQRAPSETCTGVDAPVSELWSPARQRAIAAAMQATGAAYADASWASASRLLDVYLGRWVTTRREACEQHARGELSSRLFDLREACLEERLRRARALLEVFEDADRELAQRAPLAAAELGTLARCEDVEALLSEVPPPEDAGAAAEVTRLRTRLAEAWAADQAGRYGAGRELAAPVVERARALGYRPLLAEALLRVGALELRLGGYATAERALDEGLWEAVASGHAPVAAEAAITLLSAVGVRQGRFDEALADERRARALIDRARGVERDDLLIQLENTLGNLTHRQHALERSREHYLRALELLATHETPSRALTVASVNGNLAGVLWARGQYQEALQRSEEALAIVRAQLGDGHPQHHSLLGNVARDRAAIGELAAARRLYEQQIALIESSLGPEHPTLAEALTNVGSTYERLGELARARAALERALPLLEPVDGERQQLGECRFTMARQLAAERAPPAEVEATARSALAAYADASENTEEARAEVARWLAARAGEGE